MIIQYKLGPLPTPPKHIGKGEKNTIRNRNQ